MKFGKLNLRANLSELLAPPSIWKTRRCKDKKFSELCKHLAKIPILTTCKHFFNFFSLGCCFLIRNTLTFVGQLSNN